jgi:hypothetical protein
MYNILLEFEINNNILAKEQIGFRKTVTEKATYKPNNEIICALDKKKLVGGIFCVLAKVFDYFNHDTLLIKLN